MRKPKNLSPYIDALMAPDARGRVTGTGSVKKSPEQLELPIDCEHTKPVLCKDCYGRGVDRKGVNCAQCKGRGVVPRVATKDKTECDTQE